MGAFDAVIFDWGGTLTPWHEIDLADCWLSVTGDVALAEALAAAETAIWLRSRDQHLSGTVEEIFAAVGYEITPEQLRRYYDWWDDHTFTDPAALPLLTGLRDRGIKIGVLSNTLWPRAEHERIFVRDGVHHLLDSAVYSSEIEHSKPHRRAFQAALDSVGVTDPTRALFVGDRLFDDIYGAQQLGMATAYVPHSNIPVSQTTGVQGVPDVTITSLAELLAIIDEWPPVMNQERAPSPLRG